MATNLAHKQEVEKGDVSFALVDSRSNPAWHSLHLLPYRVVPFLTFRYWLVVEPIV